MQEGLMTLKQVYENVLRELNKSNSPSLHLEDYNYFINKAVTQYINLRYNIYDTSQQTTDDLQVLTSSVNIKTKSGVLSAQVGAGYYDSPDADAGINSSNILVLDDLPAEVFVNPVYRLTQSNVAFSVNTVDNTPDTPQITLTMVLINTATSFIFKHTDRSVAVPGDMILLGNADSVITYSPPVGSTIAYAGKTFRNEHGILIELPFSGAAKKTGYVPQTSIRNGHTQLTIKLPEDYYHTLNCIVNFFVKKDYLCYPKGSTESRGAKRMTADMSAAILKNAYMKPDYRRPYFYVRNQQGTAIPEMAIRAGNFEDVFEIESVDIDYLKVPAVLTLTTTQRKSLNDTSQVMEFPNYVTLEIIKIATTLLLENAGDPRTQSNHAVNQSIPSSPPISPSAQAQAQVSTSQDQRK